MKRWSLSAVKAAETGEVIEQHSISSSEVGGHIYISSALPAGTHTWRAWEPPSAPPPRGLHPHPPTTKDPVKGQLQCTFHPSKKEGKIPLERDTIQKHSGVRDSFFSPASKQAPSLT